MTTYSQAELARQLARAQAAVDDLAALDWTALHSLAWSRHVGGAGVRSHGEVADAWAGDDRAKRALRETQDALAHVVTALGAHRAAALDLLAAGELDESLKGTLLGDGTGASVVAERRAMAKASRKPARVRWRR